MKQTYLIALGSNRRHRQFGAPRDVVRAAAAAVGGLGNVVGVSGIIASAPLGPSRRRYANAVLALETAQAPLTLLDELQAIETGFGRRRARRWGERVLDLDIVLWSCGIVAERRLTLPHPRFRERAFVLGPARAIAPDWRDPITGLTIRQLEARLTRPRPLPRAAFAS